MKLLFSWICDHLIPFVGGQGVDDAFVQHIANRLSLGTAEVERIIPIARPLVGIGRCSGRNGACARLEGSCGVVELLQTDELVGTCYFFVGEGDGSGRRATYRDIGGERESVLPGVWVAEGKEMPEIPVQDYLLCIDNQAITHRSDLWSHYGWAREISALTGRPLRNEPHARDKLVCTEGLDSALRVHEVRIETTACSRIATRAITQLHVTPPIPWIAVRLATLDVRPINSVVDATNYVMLDRGQPIHAYDAAKLHGRLVVRQARVGERLELLDATECLLQNEDVVIADAQGPCGLAGVMGGKASSVTFDTTAVIFEAAFFGPQEVRAMALRHRLRTDASLRFEKGLSDSLAFEALEAITTLLTDAGMEIQGVSDIVCSGSTPEPRKQRIAHEMLERLIGAPLERSMVVLVLTRLGFTVAATCEAGAWWYDVLFPAFRGIREGGEVQEIVEEVARMVGYNSVVPRLPRRIGQPADRVRAQGIRSVKQYYVDALRMHEVQSYAMYDEEWLSVLRLTDRVPSLELRNPVSSQWRRLVTALVPHLLKVAWNNRFECEALRFFEVNTVWREEQRTVHEKLQIACVLAESEMDFYAAKELIAAFGARFGVSLIWREAGADLPAWYHARESAEIWREDVRIGWCGMLAPECTLYADGLPPVACAELALDPFIVNRAASFTYQALTKYPVVVEDVSIFVGPLIRVADLEAAIQKSDARVMEVQLLDVFSKPEWLGQRSLTFRMKIQRADGTLSRHEIQEVMASIYGAIRILGCEVRA